MEVVGRPPSLSPWAQRLRLRPRTGAAATLRCIVPQDDRHAVLSGADDHDLGIIGLGELQGCLDSAPARIPSRKCPG